MLLAVPTFILIVILIFILFVIIMAAIAYIAFGARRRQTNSITATDIDPADITPVPLNRAKQETIRNTQSPADQPN